MVKESSICSIVLNGGEFVLGTEDKGLWIAEKGVEKMKEGVAVIVICVAFIAGAFSAMVPIEVGAATLYVGPGQTYTTIQSAISASSPGDTIRVYAGTYNEKITVNKSLNLVGDGMSNTIIDGGGPGDAVTITANWVNISGFTVKAGTLAGSYAGIKIDSSEHNKIEQCNCSNSPRGIYLMSSSNNTIESNDISNNAVGIWMSSSWDNNIAHNTVKSNSGAGIWLENSSGGTISNNSLELNWDGIYFRPAQWPGYDCHNILVYNNTANSNTAKGMEIIGRYNTIAHNAASNNGNDGIVVSGMYNTIRNNFALSNGGNGIYISSYNSTISYNLASQNGGGIVLMNLGYSSFDWNTACCNRVSDLYFYPHGSEGATGESNTCDSSGGWNDKFKSGCTNKCSLSGRVTDGHGHILEGVKVTLHHSGLTTAYTDFSGWYNFCPVYPVDVTPPEPFVEVTLEDQGTGGTPYIAVYESSPGLVVSASTQTLTSTTGTLHIDLSNNPGIRTTSIANINDLDDYAVLYLHAHQALQFALNTLKLNLDHALPIGVYGYTPTGTGTWYTNSSWGVYPASSISIDSSISRFNDGNRPDNREWHEFSHHIMADSLIGGDNWLPPRRGGVPHAGYVNPNSADSWMEGFAEFMSSEIDAAGYPAYPQMTFPFWASVPIRGTLPPYPSNWYGGWGNPRWWDLEWQTNLRGPTRLSEEFAIASILWDLEDGINSAENDFVDLTIGQIWSVINTTSLFQEASRPPNNPALTDLRDVYNAFSASGLVNQNNLDRIFIAHGAFDDLNGNSIREPTEPVGFSGDLAIHGGSRRNTPYLNNSFVHVTVIDNETMTEISADGFYVHDVFDPPHEYLNADFVASYFNETNRSIYFSMAPYPKYNSTAYIIPVKAGYCGVAPLIINNSFYWDRISGSGFVANHTFYLDRCRVKDDMYINSNVMLWPDAYVVDDVMQDGVLIINASDIILDCNGATISGVGTGSGIYNPGFDNVTIRNCKLSNYRHGIMIEGARNNVVLNNTVSLNWAGVSAYLGGDNQIIENFAQSNSYGIDIASDHNKIANNTATENLNGIWLEQAWASSNIIAGNNISANTQDGISLHDLSNNNTISENRIADNGGNGTFIFDTSTGNAIYHNNFINNAKQANDSGLNNQWDNGYPSGGNYWDDYAGLDERVGLSQDKPGSDGIGDTPYVIDLDSRDRYPLLGIAPPSVMLPSAPQNLEATTDTHQITLTWSIPAFDGRSPITNYTIYRGTTSSGETFLAEVGNVLTYVDTEVAGGQVYYYEVSSRNALGEGSQSNEASAGILNEPPTCTITSPTSGATISGTYTVEGTASDSDGTVEKVELRIDDGAWVQVTDTTSWSYYWDTTTVSDGEHIIYARSYDGTNYSEEASVSITVHNAVPPPPEGEESIFGQAWFWAAIAAVLAMVLLILLFLLTKRKPEEEEPSEEPPEEEPSEESPEEEF